MMVFPSYHYKEVMAGAASLVLISPLQSQRLT